MHGFVLLLGLGSLLLAVSAETDTLSDVGAKRSMILATSYTAVFRLCPIRPICAHYAKVKHVHIALDNIPIWTLEQTQQLVLRVALPQCMWHADDPYGSEGLRSGSFNKNCFCPNVCKTNSL